MSQQEKIRSRNLLIAGMVVVAAAALLLPAPYDSGWLAGNLLALFSTGIHWIIFRRSHGLGTIPFLKRFFRGILVRLVLTLGLFAALLVRTEIEQISFTLSFIFSYIFYSVIEMIFINRTP